MFRGRLQTLRESILLGKLGGGGSPGYSEKLAIIQRNNPLSPIILPWKALIFMLFYMIKTILEIPILAICCLLPVQYLNYDSEIRDVNMNHMALWNTLIIYGHTKKDALQSHPAWWTLKETSFHSIMISAYIGRQLRLRKSFITDLDLIKKIMILI